MGGSIVLIIVFSLLLLNFGTLYLNLSFLTFTTFLRLKGRSINTCGEVDLFMLRNSFLVIFFKFLIGFYTPFIPFFSFNTLQLRLDRGICCPSCCCCAALAAHHKKKKKKKKNTFLRPLHVL